LVHSIESFLRKGHNMSKINGTRSGCRDVFHSFLVSDATYDGILEIPVIQPIDQLPNRLISFSKSIRTDDYDQWVHFYEDDGGFERVWNRPNYYLPQLKKFNGIITPDFSLYRDMPLVMQQWNTYRGKALGHWWQTQGMKVLPNVRTADERSFAFSCCGVPHNAPICIGTHGCLRSRKDRELFKEGLFYVVNELRPSHIIFYGAVPEDVIEICSARNVKVLQFPSEFALSRKGVSA